MADLLDRLHAALATRYRVLRELGAGGMAVVFLAEDLRHRRQVALKVLRPELAAEIGPGRFLREIEMAAGLNHPHILPVHDSGEAGGFLYYVMPYVEGESLRVRLTSEKQLPLDDALQIAREVAGALSYAHDQGVVHRDIKPENILLQGGHAVVADFGIARAVAAAGGDAPTAAMTAVGTAIGTPAYMSPEQATGSRDLDGRSDVYSLGCVLYELLAGEPPFTGPTVESVVHQHLAADAPSISAMRPGVPDWVDAAIQQALAKTPADRFSSTAQFTKALVPRDPAATTQARPVAKSPPVRRRWRLAWLAGSAAVMVAVVALLVLRLRDRGDTGPPPVNTRGGEVQRLTVVAVLPLENLGPAANEYFAAGMTDEITTRLGAVSGLGVISRRAAQRYARTDKTLPEIGRELGTDHLLVGSVRWAGTGHDSSRVRITIELLRTQDERQLWSTTYDRRIEDIFEVQSDIAGHVIERLGVVPLESERSRMSAQPTEDHEAYTLYLKGRHFWNKRSAADAQIGLDYFQQAVDLDPGYSLAWVGIADTWISRGWYSRLAPREAFPKARHAVMKALEFDSTLAEAHASKAHIHLEFDHDWTAAEREYRRAIELDPRYPIAHHWYGGFLSAMGRHEEALRQAETARALDPLSLIIQTWVGLRYYFAGKYEAAIAEYRKAVELDGDFAPAHWHLGWAYEQASRFEEGVAEAERALALDPGSLLYLASLGHAYARAGRKNEARTTLARLAQAATSQHVSAYHVAVIYVALGDTTAGLDWLERAYDEQSPWIGYLGVDPRLDPVRSQPRFTNLLRKAQLGP